MWRKRLNLVEPNWRKDETEKTEATQRRGASGVVAGQKKDEDAVDHGIETDEGTEIDEAGHGKE